MWRSSAARLSSLVVVAPPSKVLKNFVAWKLNTSALPNPPMRRVPEKLEKAWAESKDLPYL